MRYEYSMIAILTGGFGLCIGAIVGQLVTNKGTLNSQQFDQATYTCLEHKGVHVIQHETNNRISLQCLDGTNWIMQ